MKKLFLIFSIALAAACMVNAQDKTYMNVHQPNGEDNEYGYFWSSSIINQDHTRGWILRYNNATIDRVDELRHYGLPVRPVLPKHE